MKTKCAALLAAGAMLLLSGPAWANLVANPNFDLDNPLPAGIAPTDWTLTPAATGSDFFAGLSPFFVAPSLPNSANFGATSTFDDELSQVLATTPGQTYTISFELAQGGLTANDFSVQFGVGNTIFSLVNKGVFPYTLQTITATATSSSTVLAFFGRNNPSYWMLDNADVELSTSTATPLPAALPLFATGIGGLGLLGWRRKRKAQAVATD